MRVGTERLDHAEASTMHGGRVLIGWSVGSVVLLLYLKGMVRMVEFLKMASTVFCEDSVGGIVGPTCVRILVDEGGRCR